jgi:hypothetical protein
VRLRRGQRDQGWGHLWRRAVGLCAIAGGDRERGPDAALAVLVDDMTLSYPPRLMARRALAPGARVPATRVTGARGDALPWRHTTDAAMFAGSALPLRALGVAADLVPAWRAAHVDPHRGAAG